MSLSKKSKAIILILLGLVLAGYFGYRYAYKPHTSINDMEVAFTGTSTNFLEKIKENADTWNNKVVELSGAITAKDEKGISLNESIYCQFEEGTSTETLAEGKNITIKGRIIGYDDLLEELKLDKGIIIKK